MAIRQDRYIEADTNKIKKVNIIEVPSVPEDPFIRRSEVQQTVNNSTLPVSSRAVNLFLSSYASITYVDDKFNSIDISKYATKTELAKKWDVQETVGSGKLMREGAYGVGNVGAVTPSGFDDWGVVQNGIYRVPNSSALPKPEFSTTGSIALRMGWSGYYYSVLYLSCGNDRVGVQNTVNGTKRDWFELYSDKNTSTDVNGVLHTGTKTPLDTLNVSDMSDTVVDRDDITVTSGAVYRAIGQLMDQIANLEARVEELDNGGA